MRAKAVVDWLERLRVTEGPLAGQPLKLLSFQRRFIHGMMQNSEGALSVSRGNGKALALDTPILTAGGWRTMGDIEAGDYVYGSDGCLVEVMAAHEVMFGRDCYALEVDVGERIVADSEHLWFTEQRCLHPGSGRRRKGWQMPPEGWKATIRTTQHIAGTAHVIEHGAPHPNHRIPLASPLFGNASLPIPPYTLGVWLGDGTVSAGSVMPNPDDGEEIMRFIQADGFQVRQRVYRSGVPIWTIFRFAGKVTRGGNIGRKGHTALLLQRINSRSHASFAGHCRYGWLCWWQLRPAGGNFHVERTTDVRLCGDGQGAWVQMPGAEMLAGQVEGESRRSKVAGGFFP